MEKTTEWSQQELGREVVHLRSGSRLGGLGDREAVSVHIGWLSSKRPSSPANDRVVPTGWVGYSVKGVGRTLGSNRRVLNSERPQQASLLGGRSGGLGTTERLRGVSQRQVVERTTERV
ncbi:unnamed protein product, partial [Nesidiocoris tenuis]